MPSASHVFAAASSCTRKPLALPGIRKDSAPSAGRIQSSSLTTATRSNDVAWRARKPVSAVDRVALDLAGGGAEHVHEPDLASAGDLMTQQRLDHPLPVVVLDLADRLEAERAGRHVRHTSQHWCLAWLAVETNQRCASGGDPSQRADGLTGGLRQRRRGRGAGMSVGDPHAQDAGADAEAQRRLQPTASPSMPAGTGWPASTSNVGAVHSRHGRWGRCLWVPRPIGRRRR